MGNKLLSQGINNTLGSQFTKRVAAAAVIPEPQVVTTFIGFKASVAGQVSFWLNPLLTKELPEILSCLRPGEAGGTLRVGVKSVDPKGTTNGEGIQPERL